MSIEKEVRSIKRNIAIIGLSWFLLFTSYHGVVILQSSMNRSSGSNSLAMKAAMMMICGLTFNAWLIKQITVKWSIVLGMCCYIAYILGQVYPPILLITGAIMGLGAPPMWVGYGTYITRISQRLSTLTNKSASNIACQFFSLTNACIQLSYCSGSFIASTVLSTHAVNYNLSQQESSQCGINFCPANASTQFIRTLKRPNENDIRLLISILTGFGVCAAIVICVFLDPLSKFDERSKQEQCNQKSMFESLKGTLSLMCSEKILLVTLLSVWTGFVHGYFVADYDAAYVACGLGIHMIGYIAFMFGLTNTIGSLLLSFLSQFTKRLPILLGAGLINCVGVCLMFLWTKESDFKILLYVIAVLWGLSDSVWQSLIKAIYGSYFQSNPEEAFSVMEIYIPLGFLICYALQPLICNFTKIIILLSLLFGALFFYCILEYKSKQEKLNKVEQYEILELLSGSDKDHTLIPHERCEICLIKKQ